MKTVTSKERSTGRGATKFTAILADHRWVPISDMPGVRYMGREAGVEFYEVDVADDALTAKFYRSNSGNENVETSNGKHWSSFSQADHYASGDAHSSTCPHCGRDMTIQSIQANLAHNNIQTTAAYVAQVEQEPIP